VYGPEAGSPGETAALAIADLLALLPAV